MARRDTKDLEAVIRHLDGIIASGALEQDEVNAVKRHLQELKRAVHVQKADRIAKAVNSICRLLLKK